MLLIKIVPVGGQSSYKAEVNMMLFLLNSSWFILYPIYTYLLVSSKSGKTHNFVLIT